MVQAKLFISKPIDNLSPMRILVSVHHYDIHEGTIMNTRLNTLIARLQARVDTLAKGDADGWYCPVDHFNALLLLWRARALQQKEGMK